MLWTIRGFLILYTLSLVSIAVYFSTLMIFGGYLETGLVTIFPFVIFFLDWEVKQSLKKSEQFPPGCDYPENHLSQSQLEYLKSILHNLLISLQFPKSVKLLVHVGPESDGPIFESIGTFNQENQDYIIVPSSQFYLNSYTYTPIFAHELGHIIGSHGKDSRSISACYFIAYSYVFIIALYLGIILKSLFVFVVLSLFFHFVTSVAFAILRKTEEYSADGFATLVGYGNELVRDFLGSDPDIPINKLKRLTFPYPTDPERARYIQYLQQKYLSNNNPAI